MDGDPFANEDAFPWLCKLRRERVFALEIIKGHWIITELCDEYFGFTVTPEDVRAIGEEFVLASDLMRVAAALVVEGKR